MSKLDVFITFLFIPILFFPQLSQAQDENSQHWKNYDLEYRTYRVTLVPGLSSNGIDAINYASKYSFNVLGGYHGALHQGFEFGTLINANKHYASGVQIAGIGNYAGTQTLGVQLSGIGNYSGDATRGIQIAGAGNWASKDLQGVQLAGIFNLSGQSIQGLQFAGALNIAKNDMQGLLASGVGNISGGNIQGLLFGGLANIARRDMQGIIASGGFNYSKSFQGISLSSVNISHNFQGIQVGMANIVDKGQGIQFGLMNYGSEFEGMPIGLISYYQDGRKNIDLWGTETGFTNVGFKLGTQEVYNMISVGFNPFLNRDVWQIGWSIGRLHEYDKYDLYSDFSYFKINEGGWTKDLNSLFKYRLLFGKELNKNFNIYGGPTLNMLICRLQESSDYAPYRMFDIEAKGRQYIFWIGATLGVELF